MSDDKRPPKPEHKTRMAVPPDSEPGLETDGHGNVIPMAQRTKDDRRKASENKAGQK